jgi:hypothetical protein
MVVTCLPINRYIIIIIIIIINIIIVAAVTQSVKRLSRGLSPGRVKNFHFSVSSRPASPFIIIIIIIIISSEMIQDPCFVFWVYMYVLNFYFFRP